MHLSYLYGHRGDLFYIYASDIKDFYLLRYLATIVNACLAHISEMGLLPWYAGLSFGLAGRGMRSWYGSAVYELQRVAATFI